ncbi:unnamed protein product, partial [Phaeothamnion confervicola]
HRRRGEICQQITQAVSTLTKVPRSDVGEGQTQFLADGPVERSCGGEGTGPRPVRGDD